MTWYAGFEEIVEQDKPLAPLTWFRLGGPARYFVTPRGREEAAAVVRRCRENHLSIRVLGKGANILVADEGVDGVVMQLSHESFGTVEINEADGDVVVGAGADLSELIQSTIKRGLAGMECLAGIPGSIGGAVRMNAGGNFGDIGSVCERVTVMDATGYVFERTKGDLVFGYRDSNIVSPVILAAAFRLTPDDPGNILPIFREIWMYKKNTQPMGNKNAGCVFKNPRQLSAGALIDQAGFKGTKVGGARVSEKHANFIVTEPGAKARDVIELIAAIREAVYERFAVHLELEIDVW